MVQRGLICERAARALSAARIQRRSARSKPRGAVRSERRRLGYRPHMSPTQTKSLDGMPAAPLAVDTSAPPEIKALNPAVPSPNASLPRADVETGPRRRRRGVRVRGELEAPNPFTITGGAGGRPSVGPHAQRAFGESLSRRKTGQRRPPGRHAAARRRRQGAEAVVGRRRRRRSARPAGATAPRVAGRARRTTAVVGGGVEATVELVGAGNRKRPRGRAAAPDPVTDVRRHRARRRRARRALGALAAPRSRRERLSRRHGRALERRGPRVAGFIDVRSPRGGI